MIVDLDFNSVESYRLFLKIKTLPRFRFVGRTAEVPDEYAHLLGLTVPGKSALDYRPNPKLFDYQRDISRLAIQKRKFAVFMRPGRGKTLIDYEVMRYALHETGKPCLLFAPSWLLIRQMVQEYERFYGHEQPLESVPASGLGEWLSSRQPRLGISIYNGLREDLPKGALGCLVLSESSILKSMYGTWGIMLIDLGRDVPFKLCETGTPAPNDRIEYANHAVFLDQFPTTNAFLARYFVNRGETNDRWEMKAHATAHFWKSLSHWCIFVDNPAVYGWKDNIQSLPPIHVHIHDVPLTPEQQELVMQAGGDMYGTPGGITSRARLSQLAKGRSKGKVVPTNKMNFIRDLVAQWQDRESTIIWAKFNAEQDDLEKAFPGAASIRGNTKEALREQLLDDFLERRRSVAISKSECLGYGLNLQVATRQIFSACDDSYEDFVQCLCRSNRTGSTHDLNAHIPVTEVERPLMENVLRKAKRVQEDIQEQERLFKRSHYEFSAA